MIVETVKNKLVFFAKATISMKMIVINEKNGQTNNKIN